MCRQSAAMVISVFAQNNTGALTVLQESLNVGYNVGFVVIVRVRGICVLLLLLYVYYENVIRVIVV